MEERKKHREAWRMPLNIKSDEAHALAAELARLTGESMTRAVTEAIRERLERERRLRNQATLAEELLAIGRRCAAQGRKDFRPHGELLYNDRGVPG
jgi:antitoxin VapB